MQAKQYQQGPGHAAEGDSGPPPPAAWRPDRVSAPGRRRHSGSADNRIGYGTSGNAPEAP